MILCEREGYRDGLLYVHVYIAAFSSIYNMEEGYHMYILHLFKLVTSYLLGYVQEDSFLSHGHILQHIYYFC